MQPDITKLSVVELKALVYDQLAIKQQSEFNIETVNKELAKRFENADTSPAVVPEVVEPTV